MTREARAGAVGIFKKLVCSNATAAVISQPSPARPSLPTDKVKKPCARAPDLPHLLPGSSRFYGSFTLIHELTPSFRAGAKAPRVRDLMSCCDLMRPATPHPRRAAHTERLQRAGRARWPCQPGLLPPPAPGGKVSPARADSLALYGFQGTISACPSSGRVEKFASLLLRPSRGSEKRPLSPGAERDGRI